MSTLMYVKEDLIIPHHISFYDLISTKARGKSGPLFHFDVHEDVRTQNDARIEKDESHAGVSAPSLPLTCPQRLMHGAHICMPLIRRFARVVHRQSEAHIEKDKWHAGVCVVCLLTCPSHSVLREYVSAYLS